MMRLRRPSLTTALMLLVASSMADQPAALEQEADRINYSLGHQIGTDFKRQGVDLDRAAITRGMQDALKSAEPLLDKQDMEGRLLKLKNQITEDMHADQLQRVKQRKADAERKRREAQAFLAENAKKPGVETLSSGLQYRVIREGTGVKPTLPDQVTIQYRGRRLDDREFDSSYKANEPRTIRVADTILGIREALLLMQTGAKWELYIPPDLAYGRDSPLAHQAVIIELELLTVGSGDHDTKGSATEGAQAARKP
jgi:FKBP-type peptidyl-prolyl cis-trans isomerase FklB